VLQRLERLVDPYPELAPGAPPRDFAGFLWDCTRGLRPYLAMLVALTAVLGAFEALLFSMLGSVVDWLAAVERRSCGNASGGRCSRSAAFCSPASCWSRCNRRSSSR